MFVPRQITQFWNPTYYPQKDRDKKLPSSKEYVIRRPWTPLLKHLWTPEAAWAIKMKAIIEKHLITTNLKNNGLEQESPPTQPGILNDQQCIKKK